MVTPLLIVSSSGWACTSSMRREGEVTDRSSPTRASAPARGRGPTSSQHPGGLGVVAGVEVADAAVLEQRLDVDAGAPLLVVELVGELLAAGAEPAARGRVGRAGDVAGDDDPLA